MSRVIHNRKRKFGLNEIYIGRPKRPSDWHFGNPFSHKTGTLAQVKVASREDAVTAFQDWIDGTAWQDVEPERRTWILNNLHALNGKTLVCWCAPKSCHGDILAKMTEA